MLNLDLIYNNLISPVVLAFIFGVLAALLKSDLKFPESFFTAISAYLLIALGIKGGAALSATPFLTLVVPICLTLSISIILPIVTFGICYYFAKLSRIDSAALAAHYGSVSIVTFIAAGVFMETQGLKPSGYMTGMVALMEVPGIIMALLLAQNVFASKVVKGISLFERLRGIFLSKSIYLLWAGIIIGLLTGNDGLAKVSGFFVTPFYGVLVLFMLEMGLVAGSRFSDLFKIGPFLMGLGICLPIVTAAIVLVAAKYCGLNMCNGFILATMAASASYIAAPAAVRIALPLANPAYYLTASLVITFPFNLSFGIPLYYCISKWIYKCQF